MDNQLLDRTKPRVKANGLRNGNTKMLAASTYSRAAALVIVLITVWPIGIETSAAHLINVQEQSNSAILDLIHRQRYNEAITRLEQILEKNPESGEALTYMATAMLYQNLDFMKAKADFEAARKAGGGATFFVTHSHEKFNTNDVVDYCRGFLHLWADGVEFVPTDSAHGFKVKVKEVEEFKGNRLSKSTFHIKFRGKSQNFRGRTKSELEPLLIIALYKSFTRN